MVNSGDARATPHAAERDRSADTTIWPSRAVLGGPYRCNSAFRQDQPLTRGSVGDGPTPHMGEKPIPRQRTIWIHLDRASGNTTIRQQVGSTAVRPLARLAWYAAPLAAELSETELATVQRYCVFKVRVNTTSKGVTSVQVLCACQEEANAAADAIQIADADARERFEIQQRQGHLIADRVTAFLAQATGR